MAAAEDWPARAQRKAQGDAKDKDASVASRVRRLQEMVRNLPTPPISVDEFIAEKRREARRDR